MGGTMRWAELRMCRFWAGGISSFPFSRAREYRLLRRLGLSQSLAFLPEDSQSRTQSHQRWLWVRDWRIAGSGNEIGPRASHGHCEGILVPRAIFTRSLVEN